MKTTQGCALAMICCFSGCGTVMNTFRPCSGGSNLPEPYRIYGGVRADLEMTAPVFAARDANNEIGYGRQIAAKSLACALCAVDLPLSLAGDTITLPWTAGLAIQRMIDERNRELTTRRADYWLGTHRTAPLEITPAAPPEGNGQH